MTIVNGKFYDLSELIEKIETSGVIEEIEGLPDNPEAAKFHAELQNYKEASKEQRAIMIAYYESEGIFDLEIALAKLAGKDTDVCEFAFAYYSPDESLQKLNPQLRLCIDWAKVWSTHLSDDYFEHDGFIFKH